MHNCEQTKEQLLDLVFDELAPEVRSQVSAELTQCQRCLAEYQTLTETLRAVDQAGAALMPAESYWLAYEAKLQANLAQVRPNPVWRFLHWLQGFNLALWQPVPLATAAVALLVALGWWWNANRKQSSSLSIRDAGQSDIAFSSPTPLPTTVIPSATPETGKASPKLGATPQQGTPIRRNPKSRGAAPAQSVASDTAASEMMIAANFIPAPTVGPVFEPEAARHFEKAQMLLRSFRNLRSVKTVRGNQAMDVSYEKQWSRRLLYQNILLRRDAETKGNLPAQEVLGDLETVLLDIANLPERPAAGTVREIQARLQRKELVAALQVYAAPPVLSVYQPH